IVHRDIKPENVLLVDGTHAMVADFGLARALLRSSDHRLTQSRHVVGTVHYMSPEQAGPNQKLDHRSDIYSLGCVLFEMLTGHPPFDAENELAVLACHLQERPPRLASYQVDLPDAVEGVIQRALEKDPDRRFQSASDLSQALDLAISTSADQPWQPLRRLWRRSGSRWAGGRRARWIAVAAAAAAVGLALLLLVLPAAKPVRARVSALWSPPLDSARYVIVPFRRGPGVPRDVVPELMLHDAFARWSGLKMVEQFQVMDAVARHDTLDLRSDDARDVSSQLGAGRYVWGEVSSVGDSLRLHASLYDANSGIALDEISVKVGRNGAQDGPYQQIADRLLFHGLATTGRQETDPGTSSFVARRAFLRGQLALQEWSLAAADSAFAEAVAQDPDYAAAYLWLAQVRGWTSNNPQQWRALAGNAIAKQTRLSDRERKLAAALLSMANGDFPEACTMYRALRRADPRDFTATFGMGECAQRDEVVVPDPRSRSGWRFRSSKFQAVNAYRDAFELLPSIHKAFRANAFGRVRRIFMTAAASRLNGHALPPDTTRFWTAPSWEGDSLVLIPFPTSLDQSAPARTLSATTAEAVDHMRTMFRDVAASWRRAFPDDVVPREAMAVALELLGDPTALDTLRAARPLAADDEQRIRLAAEEVWLRIKFGVPDNAGSLGIAKAIADSLLRGALEHPSSSDSLLGPLAMLTGRADLAAALARRTVQPDRAYGTLPIGTIASASALLVFSALGGPADSLRALEPRVAAEIRATVAAPRQPGLYATLLGQAAGLAFPVYRFGSFPTLAGLGNPFLEAQAAYAKGDQAGARRTLTTEGQYRATSRAADLTLDITYTGAWTLAALGDRAAAIDWLDPVLNAAPLYPPEVISRPANAGALMRAVILRAELARASGDALNARRWANPVAILWADADPFLRPLVQSMHTMSST
ncbi:MAG: protein kinase, partial [Gemmatimonadota bacterium]|nr:protein kinase [Gemmatimonadota bacterium]